MRIIGRVVGHGCLCQKEKPIVIIRRNNDWRVLGG
jgi:hypothetical protein